MPIPFDEAHTIFTAPKRLLGPFKWDSKIWKDYTDCALACSVQFGGSVIVRGVTFRIITYPRQLASFTFQLDCIREDSRSNCPLYRLEVVPLKAHTNKLYGPEDVYGEFFDAGETHEHDFHDSLTLDGKLRTNCCEQARRVLPRDQDFVTALARVCSRINIMNGGDIPLPPAQGTLL